MEKILIIHHNKKVGGSGKSLLEIATNLRDSFDVEVLCPKDSPMEKFLIDHGIKILPYDVPVGTIEYYNGGPKILSRTYFKRLISRPKFSKYVKEVLKKEKPSYVFLNSIVLSYLIPTVKKEGVNCIAFVRETFPQNGLGLIFNKYRKLLSKANRVFYLSHYDNKFWNTNNGVTLRNTVNEDYFNEISRKTARKNLNISDNNLFSVLFVGGASELKGSNLLAKAAKALPKDIEIVVCGNDINEAKAIFNSSNCLITYLGFCSDMKSALYATDCLVFPSTKPHQARPVFEAGATKKPVIISDFPETAEQVTNNVNGLTFNPGDVNDLVSKILELKANEELRHRLGKANYLVTKNNNTRDVAKKILFQNLKGKK